MQKTPKRCKCKCATYSESSHFLLNNFTLRIKDDLIEQKFTQMRTDRFQSFLMPFFIAMTLVFSSVALLDHLNGTKILAVYGWFVPNFLTIFLWALLARFAPKYSTYSAFLQTALQFWLQALCYYGLMDERFMLLDPEKHDDLIYGYIVLLTVLNYNTFQATLVALPFAAILPFYL